MRLFTDHPSARWAAPLAAAGIIGAVTVGASVAASASTPLPPRTAAQLLVDLQGAHLTGLSGTVVQSSDLGLPALPGVTTGSGSGAGASSDLTSLLSGTHTLRVWYAGDTKQRVALLGSLGESDVVRNGSDLWLWSSTNKTATHYALPAHTTGLSGSAVTPSPIPTPVDPQQAAEKALAAIDPTTSVTTDGTATVAGRAAYELVIAPKSSASLIRQVRIAIDAETHLPLRVQVYSTTVADPAFEVGFTQVDFAVPEARQFTFTPPPGTTVTQGTLPTMSSERTGGTARPSDPAAAKPTVIGTGWDSVVVASVPTGALSGASADTSKGSGLGTLDALLKTLPAVSGSWGSGHLFAGTLVSVVLTNDGRIAAGAVTPETLYAALAAK
jgi:outer membrane lipoprotein-sorting protein